MNRIYNINLLFGLLAIFLIGCMAEDYEDANPPRLLDGPAVNGASLDSEAIGDGESVNITVVVSDAPGLIDSAHVEATNSLGVAIGGTFSIVSGEGISEGQVVINYTSPAGVSGPINLAVSVGDGQVDEKGDYAGKFSVPIDLEIFLYCGDLAGSYSAEGTILQDDFNSGPYNYTETITLADCEAEGEYLISDITGGLYTNSYAAEYDTDPASAIISIAGNGDITWAGVSDQFGGEIIQDSTQSISNFDDASGVITIYWRATSFNEHGELVLTP